MKFSFEKAFLIGEATLSANEHNPPPYSYNLKNVEVHYEYRDALWTVTAEKIRYERRKQKGRTEIVWTEVGSDPFSLITNDLKLYGAVNV